MSTRKNKKPDVSNIRVDKSLNKYAEQIMFKEKHEQAKKLFSPNGLPKDFFEPKKKSGVK